MAPGVQGPLEEHLAPAGPPGAAGASQLGRGSLGCRSSLGPSHDTRCSTDQCRDRPPNRRGRRGRRRRPFPVLSDWSVVEEGLPRANVTLRLRPVSRRVSPGWLASRMTRRSCHSGASRDVSQVRGFVAKLADREDVVDVAHLPRDVTEECAPSRAEGGAFKKRRRDVDRRRSNEVRALLASVTAHAPPAVRVPTPTRWTRLPPRHSRRARGRVRDELFRRRPVGPLYRIPDLPAVLGRQHDLLVEHLLEHRLRPQRRVPATPGDERVRETPGGGWRSSGRRAKGADPEARAVAISCSDSWIARSSPGR